MENEEELKDVQRWAFGSNFSAVVKFQEHLKVSASDEASCARTSECVLWVEVPRRISPHRQAPNA